VPAGSQEQDDDTGCAGEVHECADNFAPVSCRALVHQPAPVCLTDCVRDDDCITGYVCVDTDCIGSHEGVGSEGQEL